jgi:hypothetical protein
MSAPATLRADLERALRELLTALTTVQVQLVHELLSPSPRQAPPLPGHLCEQCLDAPAVALAPAPWGGEMGVCAGCGEGAA